MMAASYPAVIERESGACDAQRPAHSLAESSVLPSEFLVWQRFRNYPKFVTCTVAVPKVAVDFTASTEPRASASGFRDELRLPSAGVARYCRIGSDALLPWMQRLHPATKLHSNPAHNRP